MLFYYQLQRIRSGILLRYTREPSALSTRRCAFTRMLSFIPACCIASDVCRLTRALTVRQWISYVLWHWRCQGLKLDEHVFCACFIRFKGKRSRTLASAWAQSSTLKPRSTIRRKDNDGSFVEIDTRYLSTQLDEQTVALSALYVALECQQSRRAQRSRCCRWPNGGGHCQGQRLCLYACTLLFHTRVTVR